MTYNVPQFPFSNQPTPVPPPSNSDDIDTMEDEEQDTESEPEEPKPAPRTGDDTALDADDEEEIFGTGERNDGSVDELERDDVDDIIDVDMADVTGYSEDSDKPKKQRFSRTPKKFRSSNQPPTSMGGMQF